MHDTDQTRELFVSWKAEGLTQTVKVPSLSLSLVLLSCAVVAGQRSYFQTAGMRGMFTHSSTTLIWSCCLRRQQFVIQPQSVTRGGSVFTLNTDICLDKSVKWLEFGGKRSKVSWCVLTFVLEWHFTTDHTLIFYTRVFTNIRYFPHCLKKENSGVVRADT